MEKLQTRIMFEHYNSFFHYCLLSCYGMFQKLILSKPKRGRGAQEVVKEARPPAPPRSDGTVPESNGRFQEWKGRQFFIPIPY